MTEDMLKLLALVFVGVVGYLYGQRGQKASMRINLLKSVVEEKNEEAEITQKIHNASLPDLIRRANDRLRKRRPPGQDE